MEVRVGQLWHHELGCLVMVLDQAYDDAIESVAWHTHDCFSDGAVRSGVFTAQSWFDDEIGAGRLMLLSDCA